MPDLMIQEQILRGETRSQGQEIVERIQDRRPATEKKRPAFRHPMNALAQEKSDGILCWLPERLSARPEETLELVMQWSIM